MLTEFSDLSGAPALFQFGDERDFVAGDERKLLLISGRVSLINSRAAKWQKLREISLEFVETLSFLLIVFPLPAGLR